MFNSLLAFMLAAWQFLSYGFCQVPGMRNYAYAGQSCLQKMEVYFPKQSSGEVDVVLFVHGGAWVAGDRSAYRNDCKKMARRGYVAASMDYRMLDLLKAPDAQPASWETMLEDIDNAITALKALLLRAGLTPRKLAIGGGSAGGHLTLLYGYKCREKSPIPIAFLFPDVGPSDFTDPGYLDDPPDMLGMMMALLPRLAGRELTQQDILDAHPALVEMSPITYLDASAPPTLTRYAVNDEIVPTSQGHRLRAALNAAGVRNDMFIYPNSGHGLDSKDDAGVTAEWEAKLLEYCEAYFGA